MGDTSEYVIDLGPVAVRLRTPESWLAEYLGCFYEVESAATARTVSWAIEATVGTPGAGMARNRWGVGYRAAAGAREVEIVGPDRTTWRSRCGSWCADISRTTLDRWLGDAV